LSNHSIPTKKLHALGLNIVKKTKNYIVVAKKNNPAEGFYIIRYNTQATARNMLSIPHRFYDKYTGTIGYKLMKSYHYRAIAFNTIQRKIMDAAHTPQTLFNAFHIAFASLYPDDTIYQLHGFNANKHKDILVKKSQIVLSSTTKQSSQKAIDISYCLKKEGYTTLLYGKEVFELGGTTNTQARTLKNHGFFNFIHVELNALLRERLANNSLSRQKLIKCLP